MIEQLKNVMIAIFTIAAVTIIIFIIMFLNPNVGNEAHLLHVRFADIDKINKGTRVNFSGKPVGEVRNITEIEGPQGQRIVHDGIVYPYELTLAIDSNVIVYATDAFTSRTSGLLGERSVAITPMPIPKGKTSQRVTSESLLYSTETGNLEDTLKEFRHLSDKIGVTLDGFNDAFATLKEKKTWDNIGTAVDNLKEISNNLVQGKGTIGQLLMKDDMYLQLSGLLSQGETTLENLKKISNNVVQGKGTVGQLLMKDDMYLQISSLLSKGETTLDDINHYGILFHLDKGWQRLRARRLNLMQELATPQQFRNYFNDEIDNISTSLARVSMIMHQTTDNNCCGQLWTNPEYTKVYAELLRRVARLEEYLEMYNQQVVDSEVKKTELSQTP